MEPTFTSSVRQAASMTSSAGRWRGMASIRRPVLIVGCAQRLASTPGLFTTELTEEKPSVLFVLRRRKREAERDGVIANVGRPAECKLLEAFAIVGEKGAGGLFVVGEVAGDGIRKVVRAFVRRFHEALVPARATGLVHQAPQRGGGPALLRIEPVPVPRQQRDLARDDAQTRTTPSARRF